MGEYVIETRSRDEMALSELTEFASIIYSYGAVQGTLLAITDRILKADTICFARSDNRIVATAALKRPAESYRKKIERKTGVTISKVEFPLEMGYVVVVEGHRAGKSSGKDRLSDMVMESVMVEAKNEGVFATTKINGFSKVALPKLGFELIGNYEKNLHQTIHVLTRRASQ